MITCPRFALMVLAMLVCLQMMLITTIDAQIVLKQKGKGGDLITTGNCQPTVLRVGKKKRKDTIVVGGGGHGCGHDYGHKEVMAMPIPVYLPPPPKPQVIIKHEHIHHRPVYAPVVIDKSSMYDHLNSVYDHYDDYEGQHYGARHEYGGGYR